MEVSFQIRFARLLVEPVLLDSLPTELALDFILIKCEIVFLIG